MKQVLNRAGAIVVDEVPTPTVEPGRVLVRNSFSLISTGTEISSVQSTPPSSLPMKIIKDPKLIAVGLQSIRQRGFRKTLQLAQGQGPTAVGTALGYSSAGTVVAVGDGINDLKIGDQVACAGAGMASHAEIVSVPRHLVVRVPAGVSLQEASSVTLGAIALQGVRQADPRIGDVVAVSGLGLLGLLSVQMLRANGCQVVGIDPNPERCATALTYGATIALSPDDPQLAKRIENLTDGYGVDQTIITAATKSSAPLAQAMAITRIKGTVVVEGAIGLELDRSPWYEKEIDLKISRSYGPGRYDPTYELEGIDYPYAYVRWSENRNLAAYLAFLAEKKVDFKSMISAEYDHATAATAYADLQIPEKKLLAVVLKYPADTAGSTKLMTPTVTAPTQGVIRVGLIGAGSFALGMHLPNMQKLATRYHLQAVCDRDGINAKQVAQQFGASYATTDYQDLLKDKDIDLILIATRHHLHAEIARQALAAGKSVFVEKPMAMNEQELSELTTIAQKGPGVLMVGFNRRFSPHALAIQKAVEKRQNPLLIYYRMNAGFIPSSHWVHGPEGGGRIIGEGCHIIDLFASWTGSTPVSVKVSSITPKGQNVRMDDNVFATLTYADGSIATLLYTSQGNGDLAKEYAEVYVDGTAIVMDDYRTTRGFGTNVTATTSEPDKGHFHELEVLADAIQGKQTTWPISLESMSATTKKSIEIQSLANA